MWRIAILAAVLHLACGSHAALMAIDLGSENLKVCLIKPGRTPISIVVNEMSKRKSPALVGLVEGDRLAGEEAFSLAIRYPDKIFSRVRDMLGRSADDPVLGKALKEHHLPYTLVNHPERKTVAVKINDTASVLAEELQAGLFQYVKQITDAHAGSPVVDAVITVPAWWGLAQRRALIDAATLGGLNVLALINTHAAAALQYGIERDFAAKEQTVILYDMGSGSTEVALVRFSTYTPKEGGAKAKPVNQLEVVGVEWDAQLGANTLDAVLVDHFATQFEEKHPNLPPIRSSAKAMAKLRRQVRRTKEMLSANTAAPLSVEELHGGVDFRATITRADFEALAAHFFEAAAAPLKRLLTRTGVAAKDVDAVELLGGGSRVPRLQSALSEALAGRPLDRHLDSDEAVVLGAALFAANLSSTFRLRKFGMVDKVLFGVTYEATGLPAGGDDDAAAAAAPGPKSLLPDGKKLPVKRAVKYSNLTVDGFTFSLAYNASGPHGLPPGVADAALGAWTVSGIDAVAARYNTSGVTALMFEADFGGVLALERAECTVEVEVLEDKIVEMAVNATDSTNTTAGATPNVTDAGTATAGSASADGNASTNATAAKVVTTIKVPKKQTFKVALQLGGPGWVHPPLDDKTLAAAQATVAGWLVREAAKKATAKAKNDLEAYVISTRDALDSDEFLKKVSTSDMRDAFSAQLTDAEDWLYSDGEGEAAPAFVAKLLELRKVGDPIHARAKELQQRPEVLSQAKEWMELSLKVARAWPDTKPWLDPNDTAAVIEKVEEAQMWLVAQEEAQGKRKDHEEPAFTIAQVNDKLDAVARRFNRINAKRAPKPAPAAPANTTGNAPANATSGNDTTTTGSDEEVLQNNGDQASNNSTGGEGGRGHDEL